jgi:hypothetical protein
MKSFWLLLTGPRGILSPQNRQALTHHLLAPFLTFYLIAAQVKDVFVFLPTLARRQRQGRGKTLIAGRIFNWANAPHLTPALALLVLFTLAYLSFLFGREARGQFEFALAVEQAAPAITEQTFTPPSTLKFTPDNFTERLSETQIQALVTQAQTLSMAEKNLLTQVEALNYALAFYYLGDQTNYQSWLEWGKALDPNSSFLN